MWVMTQPFPSYIEEILCGLTTFPLPNSFLPKYQLLKYQLSEFQLSKCQLATLEELREKAEVRIFDANLRW